MCKNNTLILKGGKLRGLMHDEPEVGSKSIAYQLDH